LSLEGALKEYQLETRIDSDQDYDHVALEFIRQLAAALDGYRNDPASELTSDRLASALDALRRVPLFEPELVEAVRPEVGRSAMRIIEGPVHTWMHRGLVSITDEPKLQAIWLRLLQAGLPRYAQIRHGPIEYGKDLVALLEEKGEWVLYMYQAKAGDIDKKKWRDCVAELEEMFLVRLPSLQLGATPDRVVGVLVSNGHANPYVEPVMDAWFREEKDVHGREFQFLHLDRLVQWIANHKLTNELRLAFKEHGVDVS